MKTDKDLTDSFLEDIFEDIPFIKTSSDFTENLLTRIEKEVIKEKRKNKWLSIMQIAAGILGMLLLPGITIYLCTFFIPNFTSLISLPAIDISIDPIIIIIGLIILFLLIADTLFRKFLLKNNFE